MDAYLRKELDRLSHHIVACYWAGQDSNYQYFQGEYKRLTGNKLGLDIIQEAKPVQLQLQHAVTNNLRSS